MQKKTLLESAPICRSEAVEETKCRQWSLPIWGIGIRLGSGGFEDVVGESSRAKFAVLKINFD